MAEDITVLLFDVDGVLVDPLAYKAGIIRSMEILCTEIGVLDPQAFLPDHSEIAYMEARGIHDVWDISNIMFSLVLNSVFHSLEKRNKLFAFSAKETALRLQEIKLACPMIARPNYKAFADKLVDPDGASHPPDIALALLTKELASSSNALDSWHSLFDSWQSLFESFLKSTRSVYESYGTRIFQNVILGSSEFESTYELSSNYEGPSLLRSEDIVLINKDSVQTLQSLKDRQDIKMAIYTARPSYPPPDVGQIRGYSPEAEMAVEAAGLQNFPLVGMGMMEWLALQHGERSEDLTKPNTTHSLSALLAAVAQNNMSATLELAYLLDKRSGPITRSELAQLSGRQISVLVFEDTSSGIKPMKALADKLTANGFSISVKALGIARDEHKKKALEPLCQGVFPDVNQALDYFRSEQQL